MKKGDICQVVKCLGKSKKKRKEGFHSGYYLGDICVFQEIDGNDAIVTFDNEIGNNYYARNNYSVRLGELELVEGL